MPLQQTKRRRARLRSSPAYTFRSIDWLLMTRQGEIWGRICVRGHTAEDQQLRLRLCLIGLGDEALRIVVTVAARDVKHAALLAAALAADVVVLNILSNFST